MNVKEYVAQRTITTNDVLNFLDNGSKVFCAGGANEVLEFTAALPKFLKEKNIKIGYHTDLCMSPNPMYLDPSFKNHLEIESIFYSPLLRMAAANGYCDYRPTHLRNAADALILGGEEYDVFLTLFSTPDEHGYLSIATGDITEVTTLRRSKKVVAYISPNAPRLFGDSTIHVSEIDYFVESNQAPLPLPAEPLTEEDHKIGAFVADLVEDGSVLQLGIGAIPNAAALALKTKKHLGVHTEMLGDAVLELIEAGAIDNTQKNFFPNKVVTAFSLGSPKLYKFLNNNPGVFHFKAAFTNNPQVIGQNDKLVSINSTLQVDFSGQCCSESIGPVHISGTGGQFDFVLGSRLSKGGKSIIALKSTSEVKDPKTGEKKPVSKIVPMLNLGAAVSTHRNDVDYIVTEYGVAYLRGKTLKQRAKALIEIAHPDFREELTENAKKMRLL